MKRFTQWCACAVALLLVHNFSALTWAQQGWSEGTWNEPVFTLKRVCEPRQASEIYEIGVVDGRRRKVGVHGPQAGDNPRPSTEVQWKNGTICRVQLLVDAAASFDSRNGVVVNCTAKIVISAAYNQKPGRKVTMKLRSPISPDDLDSIEVDIVPGRTVTYFLKGGVKIVHKNWDPKFHTSGPSWSWVRIPFGRGVSANTTRSRSEAVNSTSFMVGPVAGFKSDISETFEVSGYVGGDHISTEVMCIYEGVAKNKSAATPRVAPPPPRPPLVLIDPTEPQPVRVADNAEARRQYEDAQRLFKTFQQVRAMEQRIEMAGAELSLLGRAIKQLREKIAIHDSASRNEALYEDARLSAADAAAQLRKQLGEMLAAQDLLIKQVALEYKELVGVTKLSMEKVSAQDIADQLEVIHKTLVRQEALLPMQLYLAADRRKEFQEASWKLLVTNNQRDAVYRLRAVDYLLHNEPRAALYAMRKSLELKPDDYATQQMLKNLEVGYLRGITSKVSGDAAEVREKLNEAFMGKGEAGWWNGLKDIATTGIRTSLNEIGNMSVGEMMSNLFRGGNNTENSGLIKRLANLGGEQLNQATLEHTGLQLMTRLRNSGLSWEKIKALNAQRLGSVMRRLASSNGGANDYQLDDATAKKMQLALAIAMQNPDVKRLLSPNREQFDLDRGASYYATDAFDKTWIDYAGDAINVANVASFIPGAMIGDAGKLVGAGKAMRGKTVGEGLMSAMKLNQLAAALEKSRAGKAALQQLTQFNQETGVVSKMLAQTLIDQGIIELGLRIGGRPGEIAAEILTTLGATDLDSLMATLQKRGIKPSDIEKFVMRTGKQVKNIESVRLPVSDYAPKLDKALTAMRSPQLTIAQASDFRRASDAIANKLKPSSRGIPLATSSRHLKLEVHKQQVVEDGLRAAGRGKKGGVQAAKQYAESLEKEIASEVKHLNDTADSLEKLTEGMKKRPTTVAGNPPPNRQPPAHSGPDKNQLRVVNDPHMPSHHNSDKGDGSIEAANRLEKVAILRLDPHSNKYVQQIVNAEDAHMNNGSEFTIWVERNWNGRDLNKIQVARGKGVELTPKEIERVKKDFQERFLKGEMSLQKPKTTDIPEPVPPKEFELDDFPDDATPAEKERHVQELIRQLQGK